METMTRSQAKEYIEAHPEEYLERDRSGKGWICPLCGSGSGNKGTGITSKDGKHYTCWAGCFTSADLFDIVGMEKGISQDDFISKVNAAAEIYGINLVNDTEPVKRRTPEQDFSDLAESKQTEERDQPDYTAYFLQAAERIEETEYHRGISLQTLRKYGVGYDPEWKTPLNAYLAKGGDRTERKWGYIPTTARLIIPTSSSSYIARYAGEKYTDHNGIDYTKQKVGSVHLFNSKALQESEDPIFIVEGEIDALSIIDAGGMSVGLGSTSNKEMLVGMLKQNKPRYPLILALDNDGTGKKVSSELEERLQGISVPYVLYEYPDGYKDANDVLRANRELLKQSVKDAVGKALQLAEEKNTEDLNDLERDSNASAMEGFLDRIRAGRDTPAFIPTGFSSLDLLLEGGLYAGLYVIGAVSSLGKTSFCLNMADKIARAGRDILLFSLEMSRDELIAKSISRLTYEIDMEDNKRFPTNAKTTLGIMVGSRYKNYSKEELDLIEEATDIYKGDYASHIYIHEGMGNIGVAEVKEKVDRIKRIRGTAPVVIIDYLQILAPAAGMERSSDKQICDKNVLELKRLSRDYGIPVIGISSFNRNNYNSPVNLTAFKESGAIEYGSDVLFGMQYKGWDLEEGESDIDTNSKRTRRLKKLRTAIRNASGKKLAIPIELNILKNRNGNRGKVDLWFCPMFNHYSENPLSPTGEQDWENALGEVTGVIEIVEKKKDELSNLKGEKLF